MGKVEREFESPLDQFDLRNLFAVDILDNKFSITNMALTMVMASLIVTILFFMNNNFHKLITNASLLVKESVYATIQSIVISQINDKKGQRFFSFMFTLFVFILSNNLVGMIPYSFAATSHFILTFSLSFTVVIGATILGLAIHKTRFFSVLVPSGCPLALLPLLVMIEFISYLARNVSLGLRLAANVLSGHMLLNILSGFTYNMMCTNVYIFFLAIIPLNFVIAFSGLEIGIAFIQAQVFVVLSCSYIKDGLNLH
uniref:ATP synthase subunit a n=1 Tax=Arthonia kermesina TaxID=2563723 RepID=A0A4P8VVH2_9PEZI|nr:ATP synthase subunit 6 [Arthonia kermesina]